MTESRKSAANLPTKESELMDIAGHGVALKTWASYRSAERMLATYMKENRMKLELPIEKHTITGFVHWLIFKKKVKSGTVSNYLAGVRMLHVVKGMDPPELRDNFIKLVLTGKKNQEAAARLRGEASPERQPVSLDVLRLIKARLRAHSCHAVDKLTIWACCTILFHGAFRGGELLAKSSQQFDPAFTLLKKDMKMIYQGEEAKSLQVRLKMPKEDKDGRAEILDLYKTDTDVCPIRAAVKWLKATRHWEENQPAFRLQSGLALTARYMNNTLDELLKGYTDKRIKVHSFRSGMASMMATLGFTDEQIKDMGRWSSRAYEDYIKTARSRRAKVAKKTAERKTN